MSILDGFKQLFSAKGNATVIAKSGLNVRGGPGVNFPILQTLPLGTVVTSGKVQGNWTEISTTATTGAVDGWVYSTYLKKD